MNKLEELLGNGKWESVLEAYGTPGNFADSTYVRLLPNSENPDDIPLRVVVAKGYANRRQLMDKQKQEAAERKAKGLPKRWEHDGGEREDGTTCFLCDNVGQSKALGNNLLLPWDTYPHEVLLPNKYPATRGHNLVVEKEHQQGTLKLASHLLETGVELAEKYDFDILRNHPKAGMSIPGHDHFQGYPKIVEAFYNPKPSEPEFDVYYLTPVVKPVSFTGLADCKLIKTDFGEDVYRLTRTRFDTIAFKGKRALETFSRTVGKLEQNDKIFTCFYEPQGENLEALGTFYLSPHVKEVKDARGWVGGESWYHPVITPDKDANFEYEDHFALAKEGIHLRGNFSWDKYF